ncbi:MAG: hypothetical protein JST93_09075 [Acidobacteria bacterium]|nr:hypothetical protein [Acidobacteriota bacterium]
MTNRTALLRQTLNPLQTPVSKGSRARSAGTTFLAALDEARAVAPNRSRTSAQNSSPAQPAVTNPQPGDVVISPFNPLGLPISATPAPTAAEVAADPTRWRGTSFDPTLTLGQTVIQQYTEP